MLFNIFKFELRYWLRQPMVYIFLFINSLMIFGATSSDDIIIGGSGMGNVFKNAPFVVENFYAILSIIALLMVTAFLNSAAARDFSEKTNQILFTTPIKKRDFLLGRFLGASLIAMIPFLGVSVGNLIGALMPWLDQGRVGPIVWSGHLNGILVFVIPNVLFAGSIIFSIAVLTRNTITSFAGSIILLVGYLISQNLIRDLDNETLGSLLDPFGIRTFAVAAKYWTVEDKNTMSMGLSGILLLNRLLWLTVAALVMVFTYFRFSFAEKSKSGKKEKLENTTEISVLNQSIPSVKPDYSGNLGWIQFWSQVKIEVKSILRNTAFIIITMVGLINLISAMAFVTDAGYGNSSFPVTYVVIESIQGSFFTFLLSIVIFYTGVLVWKERDAKVNDIYDALPFKGWIPFASKALAIWLVIEVLLLISILTGLCSQFFMGFHEYKIGVYLYQILFLNGMTYLFYIVLAMFIQILVNNKYIGYFVFLVIFIANNFVWPALNIDTNMVKIGGTPNLTYSDMNGFGPFLTGILWFKTYWLLFSFVLITIGMLWWVRGRDTAMSIRWKLAKYRFNNGYSKVLYVILLAWVICGGFVYYNTKILNTYTTGKQQEVLDTYYEKNYKKFEGINQPRITDIKYEIDLFPAERKVIVNVKEWIKNKGTTPIDSVHFTLTRAFKSNISIPGADMVLNDEDHFYRIFRLKKPILPGDSMEININSTYAAKGFENEVSVTTVVENGSFFNNVEILPEIGYQPSNEMGDKQKRKDYHLPEKERMPKLERNCTTNCMNTYISNSADWVNVETIFSTSADQIAVAPGSLIKQWKQGNRNYFHYQLDHKALNFYSFISAKYAVKRDKWKDVDVEVYYLAEHAWNVDKMIKSMKNSLAYYSEHFGPYQNKQTRIIEFPRYASFAQAFPGTMPYSEAIGFVENLEDSDDIDMVYYVVAHEMGHQWWAHQVTGAEMQGATLLSETMAQYSALMVMEHLYGKSQMHKFLQYEMDNYLRARGLERQKESALLFVENQGYIHYRKGSVVMYYLKQMIGEDAVNKAAKNLIDSFAFREPPYPTAYELVDRFDQQTPDSLKYLIKDLFYDMTLFNNRTVEATYKENGKNKYEVTLVVEGQKLKADSLGKETKVKMDDWIEIGVLSKPASGKKYGKKLYSKWVQLKDGKSTFTTVVNELPYEAGIDPDSYLIDRMPKDNIKKVELKNQ